MLMPAWLGHGDFAVWIRYMGEYYGFLHVEELSSGEKIICISVHPDFEYGGKWFPEPDQYIADSIVETFGLGISKYEGRESFVEDLYLMQTPFCSVEGKVDEIALMILSKRLGRALHFNRARLNDGWMQREISRK